jgi:Rps23 Pro-64 3,4-dihydroxylase Tpa1-like proline 4-hydroxylase
MLMLENKMNKICNTEKTIEIFRNKKNIFLKNKPYSHLVFKDIIKNEFLEKVLEHYPSVKELKWYGYDNHFEKKFLFTDKQQLHKNINELFDFLNSDSFLMCLEELTGIKNLIADKTLYGGGLHQVERGGKLDIHADFNIHKKFKWHRRVNLILYLNKNWKPEYNGYLELWDKDMKKPIVKLSPAFNNMAIFKTGEYSYHGHPEPLSCPSGITRKSIAMYYYTVDPPGSIVANEHSTVYVRRPTDKKDKNIEKLRIERAKGRIKDITS